MSETASSGRATTFRDFQARRASVVTREGLKRGLSFVPRSTDVVISPYGKSGTTWLQQIVHGLRTGGDMDFDDISRVVPWIETAHDLGLDLDAEQKANPRAFKSHLAYTAVPKGGRYVVSLRDPRDALVSFYRFMEGWFFEPGTISVEELARKSFFDRSAGRDYWTHFSSWWEKRDDPSVLLLAFENMKRDLPGTVRRVASFIGVPADDSLIDLVVEQASIGFMLEHKDRFDDALMRDHVQQVAGFPATGDAAKVRKGEVGEHASELAPELLAELDALWQSAITKDHSLPTYEAIIQVL